MWRCGHFSPFLYFGLAVTLDVARQWRCQGHRNLKGTPMKLARRSFLQLAAGAAALRAGTRLARAQAYPARPVRIIVPVPAGGSLDILARLMGQRLSDKLGQAFIVEN